MNIKMIYFDSAATTKPCAAAVDAMITASEVFGNPSSLHRLGLNAQKLVEESRKTLALKLGVDKKNIYFTSGGTEANNWAVCGAAHMLKKRGNRVITTKIEHPSVTEAAHRLESEGFEVIYINVDKNGVILLDEFENAVNEKTILASVMHVNNETGAIQPVDRLKEIMQKKAPAALLHCDCVQSFCKMEVVPKKWRADMISISAHKIHGFKGTGALYTLNPRIVPILVGGGQQNELRPGTENVAGIYAFSAAAEAYKYDYEYVSALRMRMMEELLQSIENIKINGQESNSGNVLNVSFAGIKAEILLHALEKHEIYVSTGSACSSHKPELSYVLSAMGLTKKEIEGAIRFSFDMDITEEDIYKAVKIIETEVNQIRRYMRA